MHGTGKVKGDSYWKAEKIWLRYGLEKTPYFDTFHVVQRLDSSLNLVNSLSWFILLFLVLNTKHLQEPPVFQIWQA